MLNANKETMSEVCAFYLVKNMQSLFSQVMLHIEEVIGGGTKDETVEGEVLVSLIRVICLFTEPSHLFT